MPHDLMVISNAVARRKRLDHQCPGQATCDLTAPGAIFSRNGDDIHGRLYSREPDWFPCFRLSNSYRFHKCLRPANSPNRIQPFWFDLLGS